jgi:hypothetical protein
MSTEALKQAAEFNRYFTSANGVDVGARVSVPRDEWRTLYADLAQATVSEPPLFAASVAERKWAELQEQGHRMTLMRFDGGKGGPGSIDPGGVVMWGAASEQGEPVYWEWRYQESNPHTANFGQWSEWNRVKSRGTIYTADDALNELRQYIADGYKYELRALYAAQPAPVPLQGHNPSRTEFVGAARVFAAAYGLHDGAPEYLPRTTEDAANFEPHGWVIAAMMQAYADGRFDAAPLPAPVAMTDDEMWALWNSHGIDEMNQQEAIVFARSVEAHHRIGQPTAPAVPAVPEVGEKQSYRDANDMPTEVAVLKREWLEMRHALSYRPALAVPEGWQLVPKEPTREMLMSALDVDNASFDNHQHVLSAQWADMLASAPTSTKGGV